MANPATISKALKSIDAELAKLRQRRVEILLRPLHRERRWLQARIEKINQVIVRALGKLRGDAKPAKRPAAKARGKRRRIRRSADELKKVALGVVEFVKSKGRAGVTAGEIKAVFGNLIPSPSQFVKRVWRGTASPKRTRQASTILRFVNAADAGVSSNCNRQAI
jgi:hypothetical protein